MRIDGAKNFPGRKNANHKNFQNFSENIEYSFYNGLTNASEY
ncbi:11357_t:CDS:2 [Entrophospora sp. SA101]|nr:11357_t:CDS:2 [Entrophospora sp. SA101]